MKFAEPLWLLGAGVAVVVAVFLVLGAWLLVRSIRRFGDEPRVLALVTGRASQRRAIKGGLLVLGVAFAFVALARPQYGRGTRLIPATNLDVVLVIDYSKSMFARDVKPSRIARAKAEVGQLIASLPGARFAAVAFAGQPMAFPLTSDGSAIAQFFRQISPNDMPVGGTAIARALEAGRELLARDPVSKKHRRVMVLVTDGEDLEGDPVAMAQAARNDDITIHVVQIGGRTPEPLPEVNDSGEITGWRSTEDGSPLTTSLSADGEAQLAKIAEVTRGRVVRSEQGTTGLREIENDLRRMMTEELSERVETVYADVFMYPLGLAILLVCIETFIAETRKRPQAAKLPPGPRRSRKRRREQARALASAALCLVVLGLAGSACDSESGRLFVRHAPAVDQAISAFDAGDASAATLLLEEYLSTGNCKEGQIGTPPSVREKPNAGFDLGLGLFQLAEAYGRRFGEEEAGFDAGASPQEDSQNAQRQAEVSCALAIVRLIALDTNAPVDLRARAHYLAGNLDFLLREYADAVAEYDAALKLIPGLPGDAGDSIGRDAAWNRAIALRRKEEEEQRDAGADAPPDAPPDAAPDAAPDAEPESPDAGQDGSDQSEPDSGSGDDGGQDAGSPSGPDGGSDAGQPPEEQPQPEPQDQQSANQDERMLDMLEQAPTLQEQDAKRRALQRRAGPEMQDK